MLHLMSLIGLKSKRMKNICVCCSLMMDININYSPLYCFTGEDFSKQAYCIHLWTDHNLREIISPIKVYLGY